MRGVLFIHLYAPERPFMQLTIFGPQMALAHRLDALSQGPKNSRIPEDFGPEVQGSNLASRMGSYL